MRFIEEVQERLEVKLGDEFVVERGGEHFLSIILTSGPNFAAWHYPLIWWLKTFVAFEFGDLADQPTEALEELGRRAAERVIPQWEALGFRSTNDMGMLSVRWQAEEGPPRPIYVVDLRHEDAAMSDDVTRLIRVLVDLGQFIDIEDVLELSSS